MSKKKKHDSHLEEKEVKKEEEKPIRCAFIAGMYEDGGVFFNILGSEQNLVILDGLVSYAKMNIDEVLKQRLNEQGE